MTAFKPNDITRFLRAVDAHVEQDVSLVIIGGAAAALSLGAKSGTMDIMS